MPRARPDTSVSLKCPTCGATSSAATKFKAYQLWARWMRSIADAAHNAIRLQNPPRELL